jgi:hypothetical protein
MFSLTQYDDPTSPAYGRDPLTYADELTPVADQVENEKVEPLFVLGPLEPYGSIYGYQKRGCYVFTALTDGGQGAEVGFIKEEPIPGEDGKLKGCVYYTKNCSLQARNQPRFYASPAALLAANGMKLWTPEGIEGPKEQPLLPTTKITLGQRVASNGDTPNTVQGAYGRVHTVFDNGAFLVWWDGDASFRSQPYLPSEVDLIEAAEGTVSSGGVTMKDQQSFASFPA